MREEEPTFVQWLPLCERMALFSLLFYRHWFLVKGNFFSIQNYHCVNSGLKPQTENILRCVDHKFVD